MRQCKVYSTRQRDSVISVNTFLVIKISILYRIKSPALSPILTKHLPCELVLTQDKSLSDLSNTVGLMLIITSFLRAREARV